MRCSTCGYNPKFCHECAFPLQPPAPGAAPQDASTLPGNEDRSVEIICPGCGFRLVCRCGIRLQTSSSPPEGNIVSVIAEVSKPPRNEDQETVPPSSELSVRSTSAPDVDWAASSSDPPAPRPLMAPQASTSCSLEAPRLSSSLEFGIAEGSTAEFVSENAATECFIWNCRFGGHEMPSSLQDKTETQLHLLKIREETQKEAEAVPIREEEQERENGGVMEREREEEEEENTGEREQEEHVKGKEKENIVKEEEGENIGEKEEGSIGEEEEDKREEGNEEEGENIEEEEENIGEVEEGERMREGEEDKTRDYSANHISLHFHVILSRDCNVDRERDRVTVEPGDLPGLSDWTDITCDMRCSKEIGALGFLYNGQTRVPEDYVDRNIPYKYVVIRGKEDEESYYTSFNVEREPLLGGCLNIDPRFCHTEWHQYDGVCVADQKGALRVMLELVFDTLGTFDDLSIKTFFYRLEQFCAVVEKPLLGEDGAAPAERRVTVTHEVLELIREFLESMCGRERPHRLMAALTSLRVIQQFSVPSSRQLRETLCHALCLEEKPRNMMAAALQGARDAFTSYDGMEVALKDLCTKCLQDGADCWVWALPILLTFSTKPENPTPKKKEICDSLEWLRHEAQMRPDSSLLTAMKEKSYLLQAHRMVPHSWLFLIPTNQMEKFLKELPVQLVDALDACCFKFPGVPLGQTQEAEKILKTVLHMADQQIKSVDGKLLKANSRAIQKLHTKICQMPTFKREPGILWLSLRILLLVVQAAEQSNTRNASKNGPPLCETKNILHGALMVTLGLMEDITDHQFNVQDEPGRPTFFEELTRAEKLLMTLLQMMDLLTKSLDAKLFEECSRASLRLFTLICQNPVFKRQPQIFSASLQMVLTVVRAAERSNSRNEARAPVYETREMSEEVLTLTQEWMEGSFGPTFFIYNGKDKITLQEELQVWNQIIIRIGEGLNLERRDQLLQSLRSKLKKESSYNCIMLYCEHFHFFKDLHAGIGGLFEECAMAAAPYTCQTHKDILSHIIPHRLELFGRLVSHIIDHSWPTKWTRKHDTQKSAVFKVLLESTITKHIFRLHVSHPEVIVEFTQGVKNLVSLLESAFQETKRDVADGKISVTDMEQVLLRSEQISLICQLQIGGTEKDEVGDLYKILKGLWLSICNNKMKKTDVVFIQAITLSQLFHTKGWKRFRDFANLRRPADLDAAALQGVIDRLFLTGENGPAEGAATTKDAPLCRPEEMRNISVILQSYIQKANDLLCDSVRSRSAKRIQILKTLLSTKDQLKCSFLKIMKNRLFRGLKMEEMMIFRWMVRVAKDQHSLQEARTFRQSVWTRLQAVVVPLLSQIISVIDRNGNLDLLVCPEQDDFMKSLWLYIFQDENLLPIIYQSSEKAIPVKHNMNISDYGRNRTPFSWRIKHYLEKIWAHTQNIKSRADLSVKFLDIFSNTPVGKYISSHEAERINHLVQCYTEDFLLMTTNISSAKELQVIKSALISGMRELSVSKTEQESLQLPWVHLGYIQFQPRLQIMRRIAAISPSVLESLLQSIQDPQKPQKREMVLDVHAALASLEHLQHSVTKSQTQEWIRRVKDLQVPIGVICSEEYLQGHSAGCKPIISQIRSCWNAVFSMALFMQHLLVEENLQASYLHNLIRDYTGRVGKSLEIFEDLKSERSLMAIVNILSQFRRKVAAAQLSNVKKEDIRRQCNGFFLHLLCQQCFKDNTSPDDGVLCHLLSLLFCSTGSGASPQPNLLLTDAVDGTLVIRSLIMKLLLKFSSEQIMTPLQEFLDQTKYGTLLNPKNRKELYLLIINCYEDLFFEKKQRIQNELERIDYFNDEARFLQIYLDISKKQSEHSVPFLRDVARVRLALDGAAEMLSQRPKEPKNKAFLRSVQNLCSPLVPNDWYRIYLIRQLVYRDGMDTVQRLRKDPPSRWMFPFWMLINKDTKECYIDHFLVYGEKYKTLRDRVIQAITICDTKPDEATSKTYLQKMEENFKSKIKSIFTKSKKESALRDEEVVAPLILSVFREITLNYRQQAPPEQEDIKNVIRNIAVFQERSRKEFVETLLTNSRPLLRAVPGMTPSQVTITGLAAHLAAVLLSGNYSLYAPLKSLAFSPTTMRTSFLPTMPEDMFFYGRSTVTDVVKWYVCPNGHYYGIADCGKPYTVGKCCDCGVPIGGNGHVLLEGNQAYERTDDQTQTGHILGAPEVQARPVAIDRNITAPAFIILRLTTHLAMLLGSEQNAQSVRLMVKPVVEDVRTFLFRHIERDQEFLRACLGKSADDTTSVVHLIFHQMYQIMCSGQANSGTDWSTKNGRNSWEKEYETRIIAPVLKDLNEHLTNVNKNISQDENIVSNPIAQVVYNDPAKSGVTMDIPLDSIVHCSEMWNCRKRLSLESFFQVVQQKHGRDALPFLWKFMEKESELQMVKFLPSILKLQKELLKKFQNFQDTRRKTIREFLQSTNQDEVFKKPIEEFILAWNNLRLSLQKNGDISSGLANQILTLDSDLEFLLPCRRGRGQAASALTTHLIVLHNSFINHTENALEEPYSVSPAEVVAPHVLSYEVERDLLPIILSHCRYNPEPGGETLQNCDFQEIQRQITSRLLLGKPLITLQGLPSRTLSQDRDYEKLITEVKRRIPQDSLSDAAIDEIRRDLRELIDVCEAFSLADVSLGLLATSGGDPEVSITKYVEDGLQMGEESGERVLEVLKRCRLRHTVAVWQLLDAWRSRHLLHINRDPFADVEVAYKQNLNEGRQRALTKFLERNGGNLFLLELHEIIRIKLRTFNPSWTLKEVMFPLIDAKYISFPELERNFPEEISMAHCVEVWKMAADRRWRV